VDVLANLSNLSVFMLVMARLTAFIAVCPVFSMREIPATVKAGLGFVLALALYPLAVTHASAPPLDNTLAFTLVVLQETAVGLGLGILTVFVFNGIRTAGQYIGLQMGFGISEMVDPNSGRSAIISELLWLLGLVFFISMNGHHLLVSALAKSFELLPIGAAVAQMKTAQFVAQSFAGLFLIALKIAAPLMGVLLVTDITLGLLVRMVPTINVFMLGFPYKILIAFLVLAVTIPMAGWVMGRVFEQMNADLLILMRLLGGG
jgi:flagellar biosynthetic protein FliR